MRVRWVPILALVLGAAGCFSSKPPASSAVPPPVTSTSQSIFPHKSDWKDPAQHGVYVKKVLNMDTTTCLGCHSDGNLSGGAPSCYSCHKIFPHNDPGITLDTHGPYVVANGKAACATQCHGTDLKGGLSGVACTKCHAVYPHADAWSTPSVHGPMAQGDLKLNNKCNLCHGDDWKGGNSKESCVDCHKGIYPHPQGWSSPDQHGAFVQTNGTGKCATQCHGIQLDGGLSGIGCKSCHIVWPHPAEADWVPIHGDTARSIGINGCMGCHKNDATGGMTGVSCATCHTALPLHTDATWSKLGHGTFVMQNPTALTDAKGCPLCHGADLNGGKTPTIATLKPLQGCKDCHASYPALHKPAAGQPAWNTYAGHATWVLSYVDISKGDVMGQITTLITPCQLCHGNDLKGGDTGKTCFKSGCHTTFPHNADPTLTPWLSKHGAIASVETQSGAAALTCATANCHGTDLKGNPAGVADVSKKLIFGCADCHIQMPHQDTWPKTHGASAMVDPNTCTKCHGSNWTGNDASPSCYQCHNNYPMPHRTADGSKNSQWGTLSGHGATVMTVNGPSAKDNAVALKCTTCHGDQLDGGGSGISCYKCHASFPHAAAPITVKGVAYTFSDATWDGKKGYTGSHGQYLIEHAASFGMMISQQIQAECANACHGTDLMGGTSKISCNSCHHSYPHTGDWYKDYDASDPKTPGGMHGYTVVKNGPAECLTCHGSGGSGGPVNLACTGCHTYPHQTGWKDDHTVNTEYPPHALAVLNTNNTADKNDDTFDATKFTECAKCHGPALTYSVTNSSSLPQYNSYPLSTDDTTITLDAGVTVKRCSACHIFPHQQVKEYMTFSGFSGALFDWKTAHGAVISYWPGADVVATCGSADGKSGCHATGPAIFKAGLNDVSPCSYCHK